MTRTITRIFVLTAMSVTLTLAQGPGGPFGFGGPGGPHERGDGAADPATMIQRRVDFLATLLSLTDTQKQQATKIFTDALTASQQIQSSIAENHQSIRDAVKTNDVGTIDRLSATIGTLTGQLIATQSKADAAFYVLLTPEQQAKLDTLRGPGGHGGFIGTRGRPGWFQ